MKYDNLARVAIMFDLSEKYVLDAVVLAADGCPATIGQFLEGLVKAGPIASSMGWSLSKTIRKLAELYPEGDHVKPSAGAELHRRIACGEDD